MRLFLSGATVWWVCINVLQLCSNQDLHIMTDFICLFSSCNRTNWKTHEYRNVWTGQGGLKPFRNIFFWWRNLWFHLGPCSKVVLLHSLSLSFVLFPWFLQFFPVPVLSHALICSLPSTVAKYLLHLFLSTVIVTMSLCLFSLMNAVPEACSGNSPSPSINPSSAVISFQLILLSVSPWFVLSQMWFSLPIFSAACSCCAGTRSSGILGGATTRASALLPAAVGSWGRENSAQPVEPGWRLLSADGALKELWWISLPQRFITWTNVIFIFFSLSFKLTIGTALTTAKSL